MFSFKLVFLYINQLYPRVKYFYIMAQRELSSAYSVDFRRGFRFNGVFFAVFPQLPYPFEQNHMGAFV
jgi:hypothetical protein